jgi:hypothetical protein
MHIHCFFYINTADSGIVDSHLVQIGIAYKKSPVSTGNRAFKIPFDLSSNNYGQGKFFLARKKFLLLLLKS